MEKRKGKEKKRIKSENKRARRNRERKEEKNSKRTEGQGEGAHGRSAAQLGAQRSSVRSAARCAGRRSRCAAEQSSVRRGLLSACFALCRCDPPEGQAEAAAKDSRQLKGTREAPGALFARSELTQTPVPGHRSSGAGLAPWVAAARCSLPAAAGFCFP